MKRGELDLMREIEPDRMAQLDEDELLALHRRIRRARNKHTTNYRRKAARTVEEEGSRGAAKPKGAKDRLRAEAFEEALSRVSEQLKQERLAMAREGRWTGPESVTSSVGSVTDAGRGREYQKTTGGQKRDASSIAQGARRQAKRDAQ